jgi:hypothetical protein
MKMEATCVPEMSATLPTSISYNNPRTKLASTFNLCKSLKSATNNHTYTCPLAIYTSSSSDTATENKHFPECVQEKRNPTAYKLI